jgi:glyoxylase-like metal-dependent hydrolase (beta-lactamase superfamily II)
LADEIVPGVWWLHETRGCNVYLVDSREGLVLIDTGFPSSSAGILRELAQIAPGRELSAILVTHGHFDHAGAAGSFRFKGTRLIAGSGDTRLLPDGHRVIAPRVGQTHFIRRVLRARSAPDALVIVDEAIDGEREVLPGIRAIPVPGHTPGSYCYIDDDRGIAFVGDLVISHPGHLSRAVTFANASDAEYLSSLESFARRAPAIGCPGHGEPILSGFDEQLRQLAASPRPHVLSPVGLFRRVRRLRRFAIQLYRVRRHADVDTSRTPK